MRTDDLSGHHPLRGHQQVIREGQTRNVAHAGDQGLTKVGRYLVGDDAHGAAVECVFVGLPGHRLQKQLLKG